MQINDEKQKSDREAPDAAPTQPARTPGERSVPAPPSRPSGAKSKRGLLARTIVLPTESQKRFVNLLNGLRREFQPATLVEKQLVETMAVARWRQFRAWGFENAVIGNEIEKQSTSPDRAGQRDTTRAALAVRDSEGNARFLDRINYWEARYDRQFDRALKRLLQRRQSQALLTPGLSEARTPDRETPGTERNTK